MPLNQSPLDTFLATPGVVGDTARHILETPSLPGEFPQETSERVLKEASRTAQIRAVKARDLSSRGIPSYTDQRGNVTAIADESGTPLTNFDKKNSIAWTGTGEPRKVEFGADGPRLRDPFEGLAPTTDPKTGDQYQVAPGLPWRWVGTDEVVKRKAEIAKEDKLLAQTSSMQGRMLSLEEAGNISASRVAKEREKELERMGIAPYGPDGAPLDPESLAAQIEQQFEAQKQTGEAAETGGWFGFGSPTEKAIAARKGIDTAKQSAMRLAKEYLDARTSLEAGRMRAEEVRQQRLAVEEQRLLGQQQVLAQEGLGEVVPQEQEAQPQQPDPQQAIDAAKRGEKPYSVDENTGAMVFLPGKVEAGITQAAADGVIAAEVAKEQTEQAKIADQKYRELVESAGSMPVLKALLKGVGRGAVFRAGYAAGAPVGGSAGAAIGGVVGGIAGAPTGPGEAVAIPAGATAGAWIGSVIGGLAAGTAASAGYGKLMEKFGEYSAAIDSVNKAAELHPIIAAVGEIGAFGAGAPRAIANMAQAGRLAAAGEVGLANVGTAAGKAASRKFILRKTGEAGAAGLAFEGVIRPAFDAARYVLADQLGIAHDEFHSPNLESLAINAALGMALAGRHITFRNHNTQSIASIMTRMKVRRDSGIDPQAEVPMGDIVTAFQKKGVNLTTDNAQEMARPLSVEELAVWDALAKETRRMQEAGEFDGAEPVFEGVVQALVPGVRGQQTLSAAVIGKKPRSGPEPTPPTGTLPPGNTEPPTGGQNKQPPTVAQPPVEPPKAGQPPIVPVPPVEGQPPATGRPPVEGTPPGVSQPPEGPAGSVEQPPEGPITPQPPIEGQPPSGSIEQPPAPGTPEAEPPTVTQPPAVEPPVEAQPPETPAGEPPAGEPPVPVEQPPAAKDNTPVPIHDIFPAIKVGGKVFVGTDEETHKQLFDRVTAGMDKGSDDYGSAIADFDSPDNQNFFATKDGVRQLSRAELDAMHKVSDSQGLIRKKKTTPRVEQSPAQPPVGQPPAEQPKGETPEGPQQPGLASVDEAMEKAIRDKAWKQIRTRGVVDVPGVESADVRIVESDTNPGSFDVIETVQGKRLIHAQGTTRAKAMEMAVKRAIQLGKELQARQVEPPQQPPATEPPVSQPAPDNEKPQPSTETPPDAGAKQSGPPESSGEAEKDAGEGKKPPQGLPPEPVNRPATRADRGKAAVTEASKTHDRVLTEHEINVLPFVGATYPWGVTASLEILYEPDRVGEQLDKYGQKYITAAFHEEAIHVIQLVEHSDTHEAYYDTLYDRIVDTPAGARGMELLMELYARPLTQPQKAMEYERALLQFRSTETFTEAEAAQPDQMAAVEELKQILGQEHLPQVEKSMKMLARRYENKAAVTEYEPVTPPQQPAAEQPKQPTNRGPPQSGRIATKPLKRQPQISEAQYQEALQSPQAEGKEIHFRSRNGTRLVGRYAVVDSRLIIPHPDNERPWKDHPDTRAYIAEAQGKPGGLQTARIVQPRADLGPDATHSTDSGFNNTGPSFVVAAADPTNEANPYLVLLGGHRREIIAQELGRKYVSELPDLLGKYQEQIGISPDLVRNAFTHPRLVMIVSHPDGSAIDQTLALSLITELNETGQQAATESYEAYGAANNLTDDAMRIAGSLFDTDAKTPLSLLQSRSSKLTELVQELVSPTSGGSPVIPPKYSGKYVDGNTLTKEGAAYFQKVLLAKIIGDPQRIEQIDRAGDMEMKLMRGLGSLFAMVRRGGPNFVTSFQNAVRLEISRLTTDGPNGKGVPSTVREYQELLNADFITRGEPPNDPGDLALQRWLASFPGSKAREEFGKLKDKYLPFDDPNEMDLAGNSNVENIGRALLKDEDSGTIKSGKPKEPQVMPAEDARYLELAKEPEKNREELQRMVNAAAKAAGYNIRGARGGAYLNGVPLPPSAAGNFGPGYYVAEEAPIESIASFRPKTINRYEAERLGVDPEQIEARGEQVFVKLHRPLTLGEGELPLTKEEKEVIRAEMELHGTITQAGLEVGSLRKPEGVGGSLSAIRKDRRGVIGYDSSTGTAWTAVVMNLIAQGRLPYDGIRGIGGRTYSGQMKSEIVVPFASQIKSGEPVTYDADGKVIPLSQRFNAKTDSILHAGEPQNPLGSEAETYARLSAELRALRAKERQGAKLTPQEHDRIDVIETQLGQQFIPGALETKRVEKEADTAANRVRSDLRKLAEFRGGDTVIDKAVEYIRLGDYKAARDVLKMAGHTKEADIVQAQLINKGRKPVVSETQDDLFAAPAPKQAMLFAGKPKNPNQIDLFPPERKLKFKWTQAGEEWTAPTRLGTLVILQRNDTVQIEHRMTDGKVRQYRDKSFGTIEEAQDFAEKEFGALLPQPKPEDADDTVTRTPSTRLVGWREAAGQQGTLRFSGMGRALPTNKSERFLFKSRPNETRLALAKIRQNYLPTFIDSILYRHQWEGANMTLDAFEKDENFLLADGTGAGKTMQELAVAAARAMTPQLRWKDFSAFDFEAVMEARHGKQWKHTASTAESQFYAALTAGGTAKASKTFKMFLIEGESESHLYSFDFWNKQETRTQPKLIDRFDTPKAAQDAADARSKEMLESKEVRPDRVLITTKDNNIIGTAFAKDAETLGLTSEDSPVPVLRYGGDDPKHGSIYIATHTDIQRGLVRPGDFDTVIVDEAHIFRNLLLKQKYSALGQTADRILKVANHVMFATATPTDKPAHLWYLRSIFTRDLGTMFQEMGMSVTFIKTKEGDEVSMVKYDSRMTAEERDKMVEKLYAELTRNGRMLQREVPLDNTTVKFEEVDIADDQFIRADEMFRFIEGDMKRKKKYPFAFAVAANTVRGYLETTKIPHVMREVDSGIKAGRQVIVYADRVNDGQEGKYSAGIDGTITKLIAMLEAKYGKNSIGKLYGGVDKAQQIASVNRFQSGEIQILVATGTSGGTGISLDDIYGDSPRKLIMMTPPWSALDLIQMLGRINRLTTMSKGEAIILFSEHPIDTWGMDITAKKLSMLGASVTGDILKIRPTEERTREIQKQDMAKFLIDLSIPVWNGEQWIVPKTLTDVMPMLQNPETRDYVTDLALTAETQINRNEERIQPGDKVMTEQRLLRYGQFPNEFAALSPGHAAVQKALEEYINEGALHEEHAIILRALMAQSNGALLNRINFGLLGSKDKALGSGGGTYQGAGILNLKKGGTKAATTRLPSGKVMRMPTDDMAKVFLHELGHVGYFVLLNAKERRYVARLYAELGGRKDVEDWFRKGLFPAGMKNLTTDQKAIRIRSKAEYYGKNVYEFFAESFAEYILGRRVPPSMATGMFDNIADYLGTFIDGIRRRTGDRGIARIHDYILGATNEAKKLNYGAESQYAIVPVSPIRREDIDVRLDSDQSYRLYNLKDGSSLGGASYRTEALATEAADRIGKTERQMWEYYRQKPSNVADRKARVEFVKGALTGSLSSGSSIGDLEPRGFDWFTSNFKGRSFRITDGSKPLVTVSRVGEQWMVRAGTDAKAHNSWETAAKAATGGNLGPIEIREGANWTPIDAIVESEDFKQGVRAVPSEDKTLIKAGAPSSPTPEAETREAVETGPKGQPKNKADAKAAREAMGPNDGKTLLQSIRDKVGEAAGSVKDYFTKLPSAGEYIIAKGEWLGTGGGKTIGKVRVNGRQYAAREAKLLTDSIQKQFPNVLDRQAISRYMEAGGDADVLRGWMARSRPHLAKVYERALNLSPEAKQMAEIAREFFDAKGKQAQEVGLLGNLLENYVTHFVERSSIPRYKQEQFKARVMGDLVSSKLKTRFDHAMKRFYESMFELEQEGYRLRTGDIAEIMGAYSQAANNTLADRVFIRDLTTLKAKDGRPLGALSGYMKPLDETADESDPMLIKPFSHPYGTQDYVSIDHPALRKWKYIGTEPTSGRPVLMEAEILIHPEVAQDLKNTLGRSMINNAPIAKMATEFQFFVKQLMLGWSLFHFVQEGTHAVGHKVNPFKFHELDMEDPITRELVNAGLMLANYDAKREFGEGILSGGMEKILSSIGLGKLGKLNDVLSGLLFEEYIPGLKVAMGKAAFERNLKRFKKQLDAGTITRWQIARKTAQQANDAFGEQNNLFAGNNPTRLHAERLVLLAPDFLKSRAKFFADAFTKYGREQAAAIIFLSVLMAVFAKLFERILTGKNDWEKPFTVTANNREYELRSVPGDVLELLHHPRMFVNGRLSPIIGRGTLEAITGRDWRGQKRTPGEQVADLLKTPIPIAARGMIDSEAPEISPAETAMSAMGVRTRRHSAITRTRIIGHDWQKKQGIENPDEAYPPSKYLKLRHALEDGSMDRARKAYLELLEKTPKAKIDSGFTASLLRPFSGSRANEKRFLASLGPLERKDYEAAIAKQRKMNSDFLMLSRTTVAPRRSLDTTRTRELTADQFFK